MTVESDLFTVTHSTGDILQPAWTNSVKALLLDKRITAAEITAGVTPTLYSYQPGNTSRGDISRYGATTASSAADVAQAVQDALAAHGYAFVPAGDWNWNPVLFTGTRQRIYGDGFRTQLVYTGSGIAIDFDGYKGCEVADLVLVCTHASAVGIDIGPNGTSRYAHWWRLKRVMVIGNTPNWSTNSLATTRSGLADGIRVQTAFYGHAEHCEVSYAAGNGFRLYDQANANTFTSCHSRDNAVGVKIEGTGGGNSNGNAWLGGNIEASINGSIGIDIGEADRNRFTGRMEVSCASGGIHVRVNPPTSAAAQENKFDLELTGTSKGYELGDGSGSSQVKGTFIHGGPFGSEIDINNDCVQTVIHASPSGLAGVSVNDDGYGTIMRGSLGGGLWYERPSNQNTAAYTHDLLVGTGSVDESLGDNAKTLQFSSYANAFQWKKVNAGGTNLPVMMFGAYRFWVSPTDGKAYIKGSDPTTHNDGTVVGTQT